MPRRLRPSARVRPSQWVVVCRRPGLRIRTASPPPAHAAPRLRFLARCRWQQANIVSWPGAGQCYVYIARARALEVAAAPLVPGPMPLSGRFDLGCPSPAFLGRTMAARVPAHPCAHAPPDAVVRLPSGLRAARRGEATSPRLPVGGQHRAAVPPRYPFSQALPLPPGMECLIVICAPLFGLARDRAPAPPCISIVCSHSDAIEIYFRRDGYRSRDAQWQRHITQEQLIAIGRDPGAMRSTAARGHPSWISRWASVACTSINMSALQCLSATWH